MAKQNKATSLRSMITISLLAGLFVGIILWGALKDFSATVFAFAGGSALAVFIGFIVLNLLAKPDPDVKVGSPRLK